MIEFYLVNEILFSYERLLTWLRCEKEVQGYSKLAYDCTDRCHQCKLHYIANLAPRVRDPFGLRRGSRPRGIY